jgi:hypothetical protein
MDDPTRRNILKGGAAAAAMAALPRVFAQQGKAESDKFYERGPVRIRYQEVGSGFPLMLLPGGGLNATISFFTGNSPFNAIEEFKDSIAASQRTCATPRPACRPALSKSIGLGSPTPTISSA